MAKPLTSTWYRRLTAACGISARMLAIAFACAAASRPQYERENAVFTLSFTSEPRPGSRRANVAAASGGSSSVTMTRTRLPGPVVTPE